MHIRENLEESDNIFARAGYKVIDSVSGILTGMMQPNEISSTIAEVLGLKKFEAFPFLVVRVEPGYTCLVRL